MSKKRQDGRFYTAGNPFRHRAFKKWASEAGLPNATILEPFAGANGLIHHLEDMKLCRGFKSFDIQPNDPEVRTRDSLTDFPRGFEVCITNPPWLARNVASRLGMAFPHCKYQDIYALALDRCLENCDWVAALVPESFLRVGLFRARLRDFVSLTRSMFSDTAHPVGLAMFGPNEIEDAVVWSGPKKIGWLTALESFRPNPIPSGCPIRFNDPDGNVGLIALDNTKSASIRFCDPAELGDYTVRESCRSITRMAVGQDKIEINKWNKVLREFRSLTCDVAITPFRGLREDGMYRRRCDWSLARGIIHNA